MTINQIIFVIAVIAWLLCGMWGIEKEKGFNYPFLICLAFVPVLAILGCKLL